MELFYFNVAFLAVPSLPWNGNFQYQMEASSYNLFLELLHPDIAPIPINKEAKTVLSKVSVTG
jgi:hypothetical protein